MPLPLVFWSGEFCCKAECAFYLLAMCKLSYVYDYTRNYIGEILNAKIATYNEDVI